MSVDTKFKNFCSNLSVSNRSEISSRYKMITRRLNIEYWDWDNDTAFSRYVGSYGRGTAIGGFSDLDMIFQMPATVKGRIDRYIGNGQSALLQEVRGKIQKTYWNTSVGGDGQVVVVEFSDGMKFEVVPAFENDDKSFTYPDSNAGGKWRKTDPIPEISTVASTNSATSGNMKALCKMARAWKNTWNAPMGGLLIDTLAHRFLLNWQHRKEGYLYYDWMTRDFLKYLSEEDPNKSYWYALGSNQIVWRRGNFEAKAKKSYNIAVEAIEYEKLGYDYSANKKWREIYGTTFPD